MVEITYHLFRGASLLTLAIVWICGLMPEYVLKERGQRMSKCKAVTGE